MSTHVGVEMSKVRREAMSYDDYLALPETVRAEYVDGVAVMNPPASWEHNGVAGNLAMLLRRACDGFAVRVGSGVATSPTKFRIPDVAVARTLPEGLWATEPPLVVVEVLSQSTRSEDLFRKSREYFDAGIEQYWVVDRDQPSLTVLGRSDEGWEPLLELTGQTPSGEVRVADAGVVAVDLAEVLAD